MTATTSLTQVHLRKEKKREPLPMP